MSYKPTISIVIPTYNSGRFLEKALESIINQTYPFKEVLIVDGLSTDNTIGIANKYAAHYSYIRVHAEKDNGVYDAMNKGIDLAKGEWLYFLGSDDYLHDDKVFEDVAGTLEKEALDVLYGEVYLTGRKAKFGGEFDVLRLHTVGNLCHQSIFYHRSVFKRIGNYNLKYPINADWDLNIRCFRHPQFKIKHFDRLIAYFNELDGLSGQGCDKDLYEELPLQYINELNKLKASNSIRSWLYKTGLIPIIKKVLRKNS